MPPTAPNAPGTAAGDATSLVLAIAVWLAVLAPQWVLLLWAARSLRRMRETVARSFGVKMLAAGSWTAAVGLAMIGMVAVCRDLLGPERLGVQQFVVIATFVQQGLLIVTVILVARRHQGTPAPAVRK